MELFEGMVRDAVFSEDRRHRYQLRRSWAPERGRICWCGVNPSKADGQQDDASTSRMVRFTERAGKGALVLVNLFAYVSTDPARLLELEPEEAAGRHNARVLMEAVASSDLVVVAWGSLHSRLERAAAPTIRLLAECGKELWCLGTTADGSPRHPLYVKGDKKLTRWEAQCPK